MLSDFLRFIRSHINISASDRILLAVSGGIDSMVMAQLFKNADFNIAVAHCNFCLREEASDQDQNFVESWAKTNEIPFYTTRFKTSEYAAENGLSIQMAARELRFEYFENLCHQYNFDYYALAHHQDDDAETFFIRITQTAGLRGLCGIQAKKGKRLHPMLFANREVIEKFAQDQLIPYREDASNASDKYLRNQIRHHLLPICKQIDPDFSQHLQKSMSYLSQCKRLLDDWKIEVVQKLVCASGNESIIKVEDILKSSHRKLFFYEYLSPYGFNSTQIEDLDANLLLQSSSGKIYASATHEILRDRDVLRLRRKLVSSLENIPFFTEQISRSELKSLQSPSHIAYFDAASLKGDLYVRKWRIGDFFHPLGMTQKQKLQDYFSDHKFSLFDKENTYLLCSGKDIIWIMGHRIDHRFRVQDETKIVAKISF